MKPEKPYVGLVVCNCRMAHVRIVHVADDGDRIKTEDGMACSYILCCDPADHPWDHPPVVAPHEAVLGD